MFLRTASKIALRELHSAPAKFGFVVLAVAIGIAILTGVKSSGAAFKGMLLRNARQLIAADVQAQMWALPSPDQVRRMEALGSKYGEMTRVTETVSMAGTHHVPQMVSVKAVDPVQYPYYGKFQLDPNESLASALRDDSSVAVTPELLLRMKVKRGETLRIGDSTFTIAATLVSEPDRLASGFGPGMRVLMTRKGLDRTDLIQFGSRAAQRFLFKLKPGVDLDQLRDQLKAISPHVFITDYQQGSPAIGRAIDMTTAFLSLISLIALVVGSLGVAMAMYAHLQQRMDSIGIMKAVGATSRQVIAVYLVQTLLLGVTGALIGTVIGAAVQRIFPVLLKRYTAQLPSIDWSWTFSLQGMLLGALATLLFALPPLLSIRTVKPAVIFRRAMTETSGQHRDWRSSGIAAVLILLAFGSVAAWLSESWKAGSYFIGGLAVALIVLGVIGAVLLWSLRLFVRANGSRLPAVFRHGFANLYRPGNQARAVLVALGIGVMFTLTTYLLQDTVLHQIEVEGPGREGNLFLLDIHDAAGVERLLAHEPGVRSKLQLAGYIVSRMVSKNGITPDEMDLKPERRNQLGAVRITTAGALPDGLEVQSGHWWNAASTAPQLAVSDQAARDFKLHEGDQIVFQIAGHMLTAPIIATFHREARAPVRYDLVMPQHALAGLPVVYYGAIHADPFQIPQIETALFDTYPTVTVMNLADVLTRIQDAVNQVAVAIRFVAIFAIAAGVIILASSIAATRYRRIREVAILKTLGATRRKIGIIFSAEFSLLGGVAGLMGGLLANGFSHVIASRFLEADMPFNWPSVLLAMIFSVVLANAGGWLASARTLSQKPLEVLRNE